MEVTSQKDFVTQLFVVLEFCIFNLGPFHLRNALNHALSDAFLIITQVLLTTCS